MKKCISSFVALVLLVGIAQAQVAAGTTRWSAEKAWEWYKKQPWIVGFNFVPSTACNTTEFWSEETFDEKTIDRELGMGAGLGFNSCRVFVQYLVWKHDPVGLKKRMDRFLALADKHGISTMLVLFDDCVLGEPPQTEPYLGKQREPIFGMILPSWTPSPGHKEVTDKSVWPDLEKYVKDVVGTFAKDKRVLLWDLYNEPGNNGMGNKSLPLVEATFAWAREVQTEQPLTMGDYEGDPMGKRQIELSDIVSFHAYKDYQGLCKDIARFKKHLRPVICTEWMARPLGSKWETDLALFKQEAVGCYNWGLVNGRTQCQFKWSDKPGTPEPKVWFHDLFRKDGTPYDPAEHEVIRKVTADKAIDWAGHEVAVPFLAQPATPPGTASGVMLGSWNTQVEFSAVKVMSGTEVILNDSFETDRPDWQREGGKWQISDGICRQTSSAAPALLKFTLKNHATNYTVSVRARKTGGEQGFIVGFGARDPRNYYWLNLGGWKNTAHRIEKTWDGARCAIGPAVSGKIETGRWYDITIQVTGRRIQCFLDRQQIIDLTDCGFGDVSAVWPADNDKSNFGQALIPDLIADPSIADINGTFYCYATTDNNRGLASSGAPVVWASRDFLNWSFEGSCFPPDFDLKYWAPSSPIYKNGSYYLFPTLDEKIHVALADSPTGPFLAPDGSHLTRASHQPFPIVPCTIDAEVFLDDDGQAYMVWQGRCITKLKSDLLSTNGPTITIPTKRGGYSEGPYITKRKGIYYYFYTLGAYENYQYAYMMSRHSPLGPWESPEQDIIATSDPAARVVGPGHGCFFHPKDSEQWYFVYLEYGRGGTTRQIYADKIHFNADGTIQPIKLTKAGVGALRPVAGSPPNLALNCKAIASSTHRNNRVRWSEPTLDRVETYTPANAVDGSNGTRWLADPADTNAWFQVDLGSPRKIHRTEAYFTTPTAGHAYRLEWSLDGKTWQLYSGHDDVIRRSPHRDEKSIRARYLKLTILKGDSGLWEFRIY